MVSRTAELFTRGILIAVPVLVMLAILVQFGGNALKAQGRQRPDPGDQIGAALFGV